VLTPALDGSILAGITRDSVIALLREAGHRVEETFISLDDLQGWQQSARLRDVFGVGTAVRLFPVAEITWGEAGVRPPPAALSAWLAHRLAEVQEGVSAEWPQWRLAC
jgi:branched-chain amino acid aminotransferase